MEEIDWKIGGFLAAIAITMIVGFAYITPLVLDMARQSRKPYPPIVVTTQVVTNDPNDTTDYSP